MSLCQRYSVSYALVGVGTVGIRCVPLSHRGRRRLVPFANLLRKTPRQRNILSLTHCASAADERQAESGCYVGPFSISTGALRHGLISVFDSPRLIDEDGSTLSFFVHR
ncbi:hypothetical protein GWI33_017522 [Rhynchophorus ferrugineus]|uniref:Uncharacterized protein n=1 Tax=Rhynchophorus ferrugineus TaxID=354439 RepID=A0A834I973_RHYFE|nr:hypothetical protein GWI33_017522 [Rhynchophorus ferrugineus]